MSDGAIAIVGASCRFPGAAGLEAFWRLLIEGVDAVTEVDDARWSTRLFHHPRSGEPGKTYSWAAGLIDGIDLFEPAFFGISPREAAQMDPQQRLLLELAWHAIEDAGIPAAALAGSTAGVYVGASSTDYGDLRLGDPASGDAYFVTGMTLSILSNRISHVFDLRGPSLTIDTACSSSLVALHHACEALKADRIDAAVVGGINLLLSPYPFIGFAQAAMLSRRGRCYAFDERADGYVRGEGGAVVVLKRLEQALADGDPIRAVICGTGTNASGHTIGLSLPSEAAQADLLRAAYQRAGIDAEKIAFVEMHGTGTPAGDPAEAAAVGAVLGQRRSRPLPIGSVKTNIGHLEPASGLAGLLKAVLAFEHTVLPASLHCEMPNPAIPFEALNLRLADQPEAVSGDYAGINSFGFGGANAHAIIAATPRRANPVVEESGPPPLLISARSAASLRALTQEWQDTLDAASPERKPSMLRAAARRRDHHQHRLAALGGEPAAALGDFLAGKATPMVRSGTALRDGKIAFVFSGNGAQFLGMGGEAYRASAAFRDALTAADRALEPLLGWSVTARIDAGITEEECRRADIAQPALFAIQTAVVNVLRGLEITASGYVGHSVGEIAAAWSAGGLSLANAARVVAARSQHQEKTRGAGGMAVLALGETDARALLAETEAALDIAAINSRSAVAISGPRDALNALGAEAAQRGIAWRELDLDFAFHSAAMTPIRPGILTDLADISPGKPDGDLISTVTGCRVEKGALDAAYWWRNIRDPVRFSEAVATMIADGYRIFVEIGPTPVLQPYLRDALDAAEREGRVAATLTRRDPPGDPFPAIAAQLHVDGCDLSRAPLFDGSSDPRELPLYPWQRQRYWFTRTVEAANGLGSLPEHPLLGFRQPGGQLVWLNHLDTAAQPFLADHRVDGTPVLPAAAIIDMALAAARVVHPAAAILQLADIELPRALAFDEGRAREVRFELMSPEGDWQLASRPRLVDEALTVHATARLGVGRMHPTAQIDSDLAIERTVDGAALYRKAARLGLDYGPAFRTVKLVTVRSRDRATVELDASSCTAFEHSLIHPALLDGALQGLLALLERDGAGAGYLPRRFGNVQAFTPFGRSPARVDLRLTRRGVRSVSADIMLIDREGSPVAALVECWFTRVDLSRSAAAADRLMRVELVPAPLSDPPAPPILNRLGEIVSRLAVERDRDTVREAEQALLLDALVAAVAQGAVRQIVDGGAPFIIAGLVETGQIASEAAPRFQRLIALLARFGAATKDDSGWRIVDANDLPVVDLLWRHLLAETPELVAELALIAAAVEDLPRALRGDRRRADTPSMVAQLRHASPSGAAGVAIIEAVLGEIVAGWPPKRPLRVLAADGDAATCRLIERLARFGARRVGDGERCDIAVSISGSMPVTTINLAPGGVLLATRPLPNPLWDIVLDSPSADWPGFMTAAGLSETGAVDVAAGPWPIEILWARMPMFESPAPPPVSLSLGLVTQQKESAFIEALVARQHRVAAIDPDVSDLACDAIVLAMSATDDPIAAAIRLIPVFARIAVIAAERRIPLWLVTSGAQQGGGEAEAALWGFGRVLLNEVPGLTLRLVDLPARLPASEQAERLMCELVAAGDETEIVWTAAGRHVLRLQRGLPARGADRADTVVASVQPSEGLDRIDWARAEPRRPGPGEIEIEVHAAGINFRDVMWASGILPEEAVLDGFAGAALGLECAGVVRAIGSAVDGVAIGDRVVGFAPSALASRAVTRADAVTAIPPDMSFAAAATLPVAFVTAAYALRTLAQVKPGEYVLIHAASGAVGLAAIQIAKGMGAVVIATAGSESKRAFLRLVGADHVCDSRELGFVASVRQATNGVGVDVLLNSLHGEAMEAGIELLKPFGRFIELGKRDFYENRKVRLRALRRNASYFAVDVDQLPVQRPELAKSLLAEMSAALAAGEIRPLAHRCFPFAEIADAFRLMRSAGHNGKLVLVPHDNAGIVLPPATDLALRKDGAYVVTGGLDGFGFAAARWLARRGAGTLALVGRRGMATPGAAERVRELEIADAEVSVYGADVADHGALAAVLGEIRRAGRPIYGVIHAAAEIAGGKAEAMAPGDVEAGLRAKLGGALLLDQLTRGDPIELFWLFSSATNLIGAPGQGVYAAANAGLEALARRRHAEGLPALAIAWGAIEDAGHLSQRPDRRAALARRLDTRPMPAEAALSALPAMAASGLPVIACAEAGWHNTAHSLPILAAPFFSEIGPTATGSAADEALIEQLAALDGAAARELIATVVVEETARILRLPSDGFDRQRPLADLGMDSLMMIELRLAIERRLRIDLPLVALAEGTSVLALTRRLAELVARRTPTAEIDAIAARHEAPLDPFALGGSAPDRPA